jgi:F0F1-type ATP synthase assembly protein I
MASSDKISKSDQKAAAVKAASAAGGKKPEPEKLGRIAQIRQTFSVTRQSDPNIGWILLGAALGILVLLIAIGLLVGARGWGLTFWVLMGLMLGLLAATIIFGRRAEKAAYAQIEGQPGAAAAVLQTLRGGWFTTPMVGVTKNQDLVHRVVGKPGVVLVGEGQPARVAQLLAVKKKETARWVPDIPIHEIVVGDGEGQVTLRKLNRTVMKLPRTLRGPEVTEVRKRLEAMSSAQSPLPIPKGPMPKGAKMPRAPRG